MRSGDKLFRPPPGIAVELSASCPFFCFFALLGGPALALAGRLGSMFHQHLGLPQY